MCWPETRTAVGTRGVIYLMDFCGECSNCALGFINQYTLRRGRTITFESGPAADHNVISKQYIFNSDVGSKEGARVATSIGRFGDRCN